MLLSFIGNFGVCVFIVLGVFLMPLNLSVVSTVDVLTFLSLHIMGSELVSDCVTYICRRTQPRVMPT